MFEYRLWHLVLTNEMYLNTRFFSVSHRVLSLSMFGCIFMFSILCARNRDFDVDLCKGVLLRLAVINLGKISWKDAYSACRSTCTSCLKSFLNEIRPAIF